MVAQETMNATNGSAPKRFGRNLTGFAHDVVTLAELQCRLLAVDARDAKHAILPGAMLLCGAVILTFATLPILIAAAALLVSELSGLSLAASFGATGLVAVVIAIGLGWVGWTRFVKAGKTFDRSRVELKDTFHWIRESLRPDRHAAEVPEGPGSRI